MRRRLEPLSTTKSNPLMFPWLTGNNRRDTDSEEHENAMSDTDMDQVMEDFMMEMDMERPADFTHRYKAFSSDQLPESNLRLQIEFGGKCTIHNIGGCNTCSVDAAVGVGAIVAK